MDWGSEFNLSRCFKGLEMSKISDSDLDSLPDDMLIQILIRIPAQDLHDSVMFVCRKLYSTIRTRSFIYTHLHHSTHLLLFRNLSDSTITSCMPSSSTQVDQFKISDLISGLHLASCDGLLLGSTFNNIFKLTITNPVTKQSFTLPPFPFVPIRRQYPSSSSAIAYAAAPMEYKVVRPYYQWVHETYYPPPPKYLIHALCAILTVGVDKYSWRHVDTRHLSRTTSKHFNSCPVVTEGYVHWTNRNSSRHVLSLNIETEIFTQIPVPQCKGSYHYLAGGRYLSLLICHAYLKWEVWEMKPETGEWKKLLLNIDLEGHKALLNEWSDKEKQLCEGDGHLHPAGWLKYKEVVVFVAIKPRKRGHYFQGCHYSQYKLRAVYNIQTRDFSLFKSADQNLHPFVVHRNSLVRIP